MKDIRSNNLECLALKNIGIGLKKYVNEFLTKLNIWIKIGIMDWELDNITNRSIRIFVKFPKY